MSRRRAFKVSARTRRHLILGLLALATASILIRALYLQVFHKDFLQEQGNERYLRVLEIPAHRGMILDRNSEPLAVSSPVDSVWAQPQLLLQYRDRLPALARLLDMPTAQLEQKIVLRQEREFVYLKRHLAPSVAQRVMGLGLPGVYLQREYRRYYPTAEVTSHLLGFTDIDDRGQEGLELAFNDWLQGVPGRKRVVKDRLGRIIEDVESLRVPQPGKQLVLSIDRRIQYLAYRALKAAVFEHKAKAASVVVLDVATGEILAMVNQPAANPNNRRELKSSLLRNRAVTDVYEPGSTLKPFTIALALESGAYKPSTSINTHPGYLRIGHRLVRDVHNYGLINVSQVISKSSNVGVSKIALSLPPENLWKLYTGLGFGAPSGIGFTGEQTGILSHFSGWSDIEYATHAYGYGVSVTTLQLAQAYAVLAADGVRRPLALLRREQPPEPGRRLFSAETAHKIRAMLEQAVGPKGTGGKANVPNYRVAGKTGTVRKVMDGHYTRDHYISWFAGMAPASRPRVVIVVMVNDSRKGGYYGGTVAAPVFSKIMRGALRILNITPDAIPEGNFIAAAGSGEEP
jgi:cell division protein FtsI (penicillin-binding protein 3)